MGTGPMYLVGVEVEIGWVWEGRGVGAGVPYRTQRGAWRGMGTRVKEASERKGQARRRNAEPRCTPFAPSSKVCVYVAGHAEGGGGGETKANGMQTQEVGTVRGKDRLKGGVSKANSLFEGCADTRDLGRFPFWVGWGYCCPARLVHGLAAHVQGRATQTKGGPKGAKRCEDLRSGACHCLWGCGLVLEQVAHVAPCLGRKQPEEGRVDVVSVVKYEFHDCSKDTMNPRGAGAPYGGVENSGNGMNVGFSVGLYLLGWRLRGLCILVGDPAVSGSREVAGGACECVHVVDQGAPGAAPVGPHYVVEAVVQMGRTGRCGSSGRGLEVSGWRRGSRVDGGRGGRVAV